MKVFILAVASCITTINAVAFSPQPTVIHPAASDLLHGFSPKPTAKAIFGDLRRRSGHELERRQGAASTGKLIGWEAPDNVCGYLNGNFAIDKYCVNTDDTCDVVVYNSLSGGVGCCQKGVGCQFLDSCINGADYPTSCASNAECRQNTNIIKCTEASLPYCVGYSFTEWGASLYQCDSVSASTFNILETTSSFESDGRSWTPVYSTNTNALSTTKISTSSAVSTSAAAASTTSSASTPTPTPAKSKSNVGAIAGGVVGGVAVVGAVVIGLVWMCLRNKRKRQNNVGQQPAMHQAEAGPGHGPSPHQPPTGGYAPYVPPQADKQYFQTYQTPAQQYQEQQHLQPGYGQQPPEAFSPPTSPAPQYSPDEPRPISVMKPEAQPEPAQLDAPTHVPTQTRDGRAVYEVGG